MFLGLFKTKQDEINEINKREKILEEFKNNNEKGIKIVQEFLGKDYLGLEVRENDMYMSENDRYFIVVMIDSKNAISCFKNYRYGSGNDLYIICPYDSTLSIILQENKIKEIIPKMKEKGYKILNTPSIGSISSELSFLSPTGIKEVWTINECLEFLK